MATATRKIARSPAIVVAGVRPASEQALRSGGIGDRSPCAQPHSARSLLASKLRRHDRELRGSTHVQQLRGSGSSTQSIRPASTPRERSGPLRKGWEAARLRSTMRSPRVPWRLRSVERAAAPAQPGSPQPLAQLPPDGGNTRPDRSRRKPLPLPAGSRPDSGRGVESQAVVGLCGPWSLTRTPECAGIADDSMRVRARAAQRNPVRLSPSNCAFGTNRAPCRRTMVTDHCRQVTDAGGVG